MLLNTRKVGCCSTSVAAQHHEHEFCVIFIQVLKVKKLRDVVFSNLFPTAEMVISMSREFGIPLTYDDFENEQLKPALTTEQAPGTK